MSIAFYFPDEKCKTIKAWCKVRWCKKIEEKEYMIGIEFVEIEEYYKKKILDYVNKNISISLTYPEKET